MEVDNFQTHLWIHGWKNPRKTWSAWRLCPGNKSWLVSAWLKVWDLVLLIQSIELKIVRSQSRCPLKEVFDSNDPNSFLILERCHVAAPYCILVCQWPEMLILMWWPFLSGPRLDALTSKATYQMDLELAVPWHSISAIYTFRLRSCAEASMCRGWIPVLCLLDVWPSLHQLSAALTDCEHWKRQKVHPAVPGRGAAGCSSADRAAPQIALGINCGRLSK